MNEGQIKFFQRATIVGVIAPILFVGAFTIEGWLRPEYNSIKTYVSALSLGHQGLVQIINFLVFGILFFLFARAVATEYRSRKISQAGPILITVFAICLFLSGPFVMDPMETPILQASTHGTVHGILGGIAFLIMPISCFVFLRRFRQDSRWESFVPWTFLIAVLLSATLALFIFATKFTIGQNIFHAWLGFIQRMVLVPYMLWLSTFALAFYRRIK
ncbi:MAG TPA: DUF998 domain-containing protein [Bacteroidia bacterium]|jgi:hypothetical protein|nr:DUF998 domain-containing protein [Bacteroidia bacterium]